ncbi:MAG: metallophosphatase [Bacteroidales bacterium]|jgi:5'-nucleotidase|nr:metallophosphatase [Bacteroidales bacterium]MDD2264395.1 metallophosphatase [Bacteroidales bacterium]MDD2831629.1 metallophosphatase [Bacteroidales bacterium]MDD3209194.1 metallophosphatase [Bacteroidales bacterium]MDD3697521.1 metallophosphatase [Bacteroidales bacterium]
MKKNKLHKISLIFFLAFPFPVMGQDVVIVHTNDFHSQIEPFVSGRDAGTGGLLSLSGYLEEMRKEHPDLLYLDAGDYNQGTPYFNLFGGMVEVESMNALGLDATVLGNHEFDNGLEDLVKRLKKADCHILCANYDIRYRPLRRIVKPYVIFNLGQKKVGVIGLTIDLKGLTSNEVLRRMHYKDPIQIANRLASRLKRKGCDLIICLTHLGLKGDIELATQSRTIDLIIGGHSHTFLKEPVIQPDMDGKKVVIVQTGAYGVYAGRIDITF